MTTAPETPRSAGFPGFGVRPRFAEARLLEALADSPVVLIHGPRQCGKTTLAQRIGETAGYAYFTFDDEITLGAAKGDPVGFVDSLPARAILDEVQRVPELFRSLKLAIDRRRTSGWDPLESTCRHASLSIL